MSDDKTFRYQLLDRLKMDCNYFLGPGNGYEKRLWANDVAAQIKKMKELYNSFPDKEKPEWISMEEINEYEKDMLAYKDVLAHLQSLQIGNLQYDGEGYLYFTIVEAEYQLDGLYRIHDPENGKDMDLVSIDYGYLHPIIAEKWDEIETTLSDYVKIKYMRGKIDGK